MQGDQELSHASEMSHSKEGSGKEHLDMSYWLCNTTHALQHPSALLLLLTWPCICHPAASAAAGSQDEAAGVGEFGGGGEGADSAAMTAAEAVAAALTMGGDAAALGLAAHMGQVCDVCILSRLS